MEIDKRNGNVAFNDLNHKYWDITDESKKYISVTTLIERYGQPFNETFWSNYKALQKIAPDAFRMEKKNLLLYMCSGKTLTCVQCKFTILWRLSNYHIVFGGVIVL